MPPRGVREANDTSQSFCHLIGQNEVIAVIASGEIETSLQATLGINTTTTIKKNTKNGLVITLFYLKFYIPPNFNSWNSTDFKG